MTPAGRGVLGVLALVLGLGALLAGDPEVSDGPAVLPPEARIEPLELARSIMARDPAIVLLDLRSQEAFEDYHLPGARHAPLPPEDPGAVADRVVVVYGGEGAASPEARERLLSAGAREVRILEGGVEGWLRRVMNPVLADDADPEERRAFLDAAEVSRYFGGVPRIVPREEMEEEPGSVPEIVESMRLRGCRGG